MLKTVFSILLFCIISAVSYSQQGNGKKVYADYHGTRYSRKHDGMLGRWSYYDNTSKSVTALKRLSYNADNILENGQHDIAAVAYPLTGIQSNLDPDFVEYQILTAKSAKIDGFFIEWGYPEHESTLLLNAMQKVAAKYDFEIGVNWCDGWLYYDWITKVKPEIKTREDKTKHFRYAYQYLIDSVFSVKTAPRVKGKPVYYLFGGGITPTEYQSVVDSKDIENVYGKNAPQTLRRIIEWGKIEGRKYTPAPMSEDTRQWQALDMMPTAWIPARVRPMDKTYPHWDHYATRDDVLRYMAPFKEKLWDGANPKGLTKSGFVVPGMDNRGCGGWGRGHFFYIPRDNGQTYEDLWKLNMQSKDSLDMVFIASWSDYTEGHEIEPTVENGYRELETTLKYASAFKNEKMDKGGLELPLRLFKLRKDYLFLTALKASVLQAKTLLDDAALAISQQDFMLAEKKMGECESIFTEQHKKVKSKNYIISRDLLVNGKRTPGLLDTRETKINLGQALRKKLDNNYYTGYITFEYLDEGIESLIIKSETNKLPKSKYAVVGEIRTKGTGDWKKAKIKLIDQNIAFKDLSDNADFVINGKVKVRNLSFDFTVFEPLK
ncbi:glycoside hydrolase family 71/99-like protein [Pseudopedobacter beijingensis]|uniref:Glycoside hydrolase family 71/99-like protein n=1 Tax=Pseudopedobacter beijingensis TaxID=1207056 RepID=A0ABW4ID36_9SPHI